MPKHKHKYKRKRSWDEELIYFVVKVVGLTALFFILAAGADVYRFAY